MPSTEAKVVDLPNGNSVGIILEVLEVGVFLRVVSMDNTKLNPLDTIDLIDPDNKLNLRPVTTQDSTIVEYEVNIESMVDVLTAISNVSP